MKKLLIKILFSFLALAAVLALVYEIAARDAKKRWIQARADAHAKGLYATLDDLIPPPVPDDNNFAMLPLFEKQNEALRKNEPLAVDDKPAPGLKALSAAYNAFKDGNVSGAVEAFRNESKTPVEGSGPEALLAAVNTQSELLDVVATGLRERWECVYPIQWNQTFTATLPDMTFLMNCARAFALRADALMLSGQPEKAADDIECIILLGNRLEKNPMLIFQLVRISIYQTALQPIKFGQQRHLLRIQEWARVRPMLQGLEIELSFRRSLLMEQANAGIFIEGTLIAGKQPVSDMLGMVDSAGVTRRDTWWMSLVPKRLIGYENLISYFDNMQILIAALPEGNEFDPAKINEADRRVSERLSSRSWRNILASLAIPAVSTTSFRGAQVGERMRIADAAIGLEMEFLKAGRYPETMADKPADWSYTVANDGAHFKIVSNSPIAVDTREKDAANPKRTPRASEFTEWEG